MTHYQPKHLNPTKLRPSSSQPSPDQTNLLPSFFSFTNSFSYSPVTTPHDSTQPSASRAREQTSHVCSLSLPLRSLPYSLSSLPQSTFKLITHDSFFSLINRRYRFLPVISWYTRSRSLSMHWLIVFRFRFRLCFCLIICPSLFVFMSVVHVLLNFENLGFFYFFIFFPLMFI